MNKSDADVHRLYHIAERQRWSDGSESGSYNPASMDVDGFIHCSFERQVQRSLDKFFSSQGAVVVLEIDPGLLKSEVRVEPADGDEFPHIYGAINVDAVVATKLLVRGDEGRLTFAPR